jgi:hypothetical protein
MRNTIPEQNMLEGFAFHWEGWAMFKLCRSSGLYTLLICSWLLPSSQAHAFDLTGAWATSADQCSKVFVKKGDKISFAQFSEEFGGGFIAEGNGVRSKTAQCTIKSRKETGDSIDFHAACASEIMATSVNLRLKILDANSVERIFTDPDMAGMQLTFYRCTL